MTKNPTVNQGRRTARKRKLTRLKQIGLSLGRGFNAYELMLARHMRSCAVQDHVRPGQGSFLFALFENDAQAPTELAEQLHVQKSTVTRTVARMRKQGLVETRPDERDGGSQRVCLTPLAYKIEPDCRDLADRVEEILNRDFSDGERAILGDLMERLTGAVTQEHARPDAR